MAEHRLYEFGNFRLDPMSRRLFRDGQMVALTPKVFDLLLVLVESRDRIVTRQELLNAIWPGTFVEEANLTQNISVLRKLLSTAGTAEAYIETIPRQGYRFCARVRESEFLSGETLTVDHAQTRFVIKEEASRLSWRLGALCAVVTIALVAGLFGFWLSPRRGGRMHPGIDSLVVLPFVDLSSAKDNEYFSDGLTEELINTLAPIEGLRIVASTTAFQFKGKTHDLRSIGRRLGVTAVLEGSIRSENNRIRVTVHLNTTADGYLVWSETYDYDMTDVFAVQEAIARAIVDRLKLKITADRRSSPVKKGTRNREAYQLYLKGRHAVNQRTQQNMQKAIDLFQQALAKDSGYAAAYAALADTYTLLAGHGHLAPQDAVAKGRTAAEKALAMDETLSEAHATLGHIKYVYEWDWKGADREFRRALELNPGNVTARMRYSSMCLLLQGRTEEAIAEAERARDIDPLSANANWSLAAVLYRSRAYDRAIAQARLALDMEPNFYPAYIVLGLSLLQKKTLDEAVAVLEKASNLSAGAPRALGALGYAYAVSGRREAALKLLQKLMREPVLQASAVAQIYLGLRERDRAVWWLDRAVAEERTGLLPAIKVDPIYDALRGDRRFFGLIRRMGLDH